MYICDSNAYSEDRYLNEIEKILKGDDNMSTTKLGFTKMSAEEFKTWIKKQGNYRYSGIQIHHTWSPSYKNFYKADGSPEDEIIRQYNMKQYHVKTNGWADIAQHFTIFPNGVVVTGRSLANTTPVGIKGWNANKICIEIYGNFDKGQDVMTEEQKQAVIVVYGELCKKFNITPSIDTIRCHAWFTSGGAYLGDYNPGRSAKTCPGTNFMGFGNTKAAIQNNFIPLIKHYVNTGETSKTTSTSTSTSTGCGIYKVTTETLNIRKGPGTSHEVVGTVKKGESFTITKINGDWGYLKSGAGWIHLGYTEKHADTVETNTTPSTACGVYKVTTETLNIRKGPDASHDIVGTVKKGESFTITKINGNWGYLKSGAGWIHLGYTEKIK